MPKVSLAETTTDWERLLRSAEPYGEVKELKVHLADLRAALLRLKELQALRQELRARSQRATQEIGEVRENGNVFTIQIRSILKGALGHGNERLVEFGIRPRRSRRSREAPQVKPEDLRPPK